MSRPVPADGLLHPVALGAVALLALNDHVLKAAYASWWTGKLSDVAGMVFFPLLLQAVMELGARAAGRPWGPSRQVLIAAAAGTALGFSLVQVWPPATEAYRLVWGALFWPLASVGSVLAGDGLAAFRPVRIWADPSDVLAVPAALVAVWSGWGRTRRPRTGPTDATGGGRPGPSSERAAAP